MERGDGGGLPNTASDFIGELFDGSIIPGGGEDGGGGGGGGGGDLNGIVLEGRHHNLGGSNSNHHNVYNHHNHHHHPQLQFMGGGDEDEISRGGEHEDEAMHPLSEFQFMEDVGEYGVAEHQTTTAGQPPPVSISISLSGAGDYSSVVIKQEEGTTVENGIISNCNGMLEDYSCSNGNINNGEIKQEIKEEEEDYRRNQEDNERRKQRIKKKIRVVKDVEYFGRININAYLRSRNYRQIRKTITKGDIARCICPEVSLLNMVLNGSNYETEDIFIEYDRFWKFYCWTKVRNTRMSLELKPMLIPILAFFFRELYISRLLQQAFKLVTDFCKRLIIEEKSKESRIALMKLVEIQNPKEFEEDERLNEIYTGEHRYVLSEWTFTHLKRFLSKPKRTVLVNLLSRFFIIELRSTQELIERYINDGEEKTESSFDKDDDSEVLEVLKDLRGNVVANLPSVIAYTTNGRPTSGAISPGATTVAFGMSGSGIRIFNSKSAKKLFGIKLEPGSEAEASVPECRTVSGHTGSVYGVDFHPRTKLLFSAGQDKTLRAWNFCHETETPCRATYRGHLGPIWCMSITNSGHLLATGSSDTTARLWVPERSDCVRVLVGHHYDVDSVTFHPNEAYLATGSLDKSVRLWSVSEGKVCRMMTSSKGRVSAITFDKSGKYLIAGGEENRIRIWDVAQGTLVAQLPSATNCKDLAICGNMLAGCFDEGVVTFWNIRRIVGGEEYNDAVSETSNITIPEPHDINCETKNLLRLHYKDPSSLFCLGRDPVSTKKGVVIREWENDVKPNPLALARVLSTPAVFDRIPIPASSSPPPTQLPLPNTNKFTIKVENTVGEDEETEEVPEDELLSDPLASSSPINNSSSSPNNTTEETTRDFMDETEGENTNNTITSSDMEFEVDEQMLQSLVDGTLL